MATEKKARVSIRLHQLVRCRKMQPERFLTLANEPVAPRFVFAAEKNMS
jgi:hypothetical protein